MNKIDRGDISFEVLKCNPSTVTSSTIQNIDETRLIAFYLPQFHRVKENDQWWGEGFTEWTNVANAKPNFLGHYQPHVPRDLGFYDLDNLDTLKRQVRMAKEYGISGFCFYYYWFSGRRILEKPLDKYINSDIDFPFCLCWANENWTRTWDGDTKSVLLQQNYEAGFEVNLAESLVVYLKHPNYIRVNGKPLLVIYRAKDIPDPSGSLEKIRVALANCGVGEIELSVVDFYDIDNPNEVSADSMVEFPPHKFNGPQNKPSFMPEFQNKSFSGSVLDYTKIIAQSILKKDPPFKYYRGIIPSWDNTARRQNNPTTIINSTPRLYGIWLKFLRVFTRNSARSPDERIIFINAWNEWGEGCHLEPDLNFKTKYLEETLRSSFLTGVSDFDCDWVYKELETEARFIKGFDTARIKKHSPQSRFVSKISGKLKRFKLLHSLAKQTYNILHRLTYK